MLISLRSDHKAHLELLTKQSEQVVGDFCKLAEDFLENGPNLKLYESAAGKIGVTGDEIQNGVYGLINLLSLACKHQLSQQDFRDSVLTVGFSDTQQQILSKFFDTHKQNINKIRNSTLDEPHYHDLEWRFEVQLSSRSLLKQCTPLIAMDLTLKTPQNGESQLSHNFLQTDPVNLVHLANELENALNESRSRYCRKVQRALGNLQM